MTVSLQSILGASAATSLLGTSATGSRSLTGGLASTSNGLSSLLSSAIGVQGTEIESAAVRVAKAQFTTPYVTPPWVNAKGEPASNPNLASIRSMKSLVDPRADSSLPADLGEAFTTYRALDRMKAVAEAASSATIGASERASLSATFEQGLADLRKFLGTISPQKLNLYFEAPARVAASSPVRQGASVTSSFLKGVVDTRTAELTSLAGEQSLSLTIRQGATLYPVNVNLKQINGTLTLDKLANAINQAIGTYTAKDSNGAPLLDSSGNPVSLLLTKFSVKNENGKWGLAVESVPNEVMWSVPPQSGKSLMVIGTQTFAKEIAPVQVQRIDDFTAQARPRSATTISAIDSDATALAKIASSSAKDVAAKIDVASAASDAEGNTYILGTTAGAVDNVTAAGEPEMFIRKVSASGALVWQRPIDTSLRAQASALSIGKDGNLVVAGSVTGGSRETQPTDSDMFAARFDLNGVELSRATLSLTGDQRATGVSADASGNMYLTTRNGISGGGLYKFDAAGKLVSSVTSTIDRFSALQVAPDSTVVVLGRGIDGSAFVERYDSSLVATGRKLDLGDLQPADMVVASDGTVAVSGTVFKPGTADKDAVVSIIRSNLASEQRIVLETTANEEADSLIYTGDAFYLAGRTSGDLDGTRTGSVDGFVSKIDPRTGALTETLQFGRPGVTTGPLVISESVVSSAALESVGLGTGMLTPPRESKLVDTTRLRAGDSFQLKLDSGKVQTFKIEPTDTLPSLANRIRTAMGKAITVTTTNGPSGMTLRMQPTTGHALQVIAGPAESDALEKLGLKAARLFAPPPASPKEPKVKPGGQYGLDLSDSLTLSTQDNAKLALGKIKAALSMTQTAYRSLYWSDAMAAKVEGIRPLNSAQASQLQQYRAAIARLGG